VRIIAIQGGKGGIFKTGTAQTVAAWLERANVKWRGADTDQENKTLHDVYQDQVTAFDVYDPADGRLLLSHVNLLVNDVDAARAAGHEVYLLDQGAGQANVLRGALQKTGMLDLVRAGDVKLTIAFVVVNTDASLTTLHTALSTTFPDVERVQWLVVANEYKDSPDSTVRSALNDPELTRLIRERHAAVITLPLIEDDSVVLAWENSHAPLSRFARTGGFAERGRINVWMNTVFAELDSVSAQLRDEPANAKPKRERAGAA
jgi:hypothetical protein